MDKIAQIFTANRQKVLRKWETEVNQKVDASSQTDKIILRDHLPNLLDDVADILNRYETPEEAVQDEGYREIIANSVNHGRHRAASAEYTIDQVIHEYIIFHQVLTQELRSQGVYSTDIADLLKYTIETAMLQSTKAFVLSMQEMQETLIGTVAHDIRSPLSTAYSLLELMSQQYKQEKFESFRQMAQLSLQKSLKLTEGLLDAITTRAGEGMMLTFAKDDIVKEIKTVYEEADHIYAQEIRLECPSKEIIVVADSTALRRLLENLLTNAIKYGDITKPVTIRVEDHDDTVKLSVHNYGNPISTEQQESIFKFLNHRPKEDTSGRQSWGIGLTLVKIVAKSHGGHVSLTSSEEEGTRFTIVISKNNEIGKRRTHVFNRE